MNDDEMESCGHKCSKHQNDFFYNWSDLNSTLNVMASGMDVLRSSLAEKSSMIFSHSDFLKKNSKENIEYLINQFRFIQLSIWFENYFYNIFSDILHIKPILIGGEKEIKLKDLLNESKQKIIDDKIENFLNKIIYKDYLACIQHLETFQVKYKLSKDKENKINLFQNIRNVILHSNGMVDRKFLSQVNNLKYNLNDKIQLSNKEINSWFSFLYKDIIHVLDDAVVQKYSVLEIVDLKTPTIYFFDKNSWKI